MSEQQATVSSQAGDLAEAGVAGLNALQPGYRAWPVIFMLMFAALIMSNLYQSVTGGERSRQFLDAADQRRLTSVQSIMSMCTQINQRQLDEHREQRTELTDIINGQAQMIKDFQAYAVEGDERTGRVLIDTIQDQQARESKE